MEKILEKLSLKLGVTIEYLWEALLNQAFYSGMVDLFIFLIIIISIYGYYRWIKYIIPSWKKIDNENFDIIYTVGLVFGGVGLIIIIIDRLSNLYLTLAAFFNPEYWALMQILE